MFDRTLRTRDSKVSELGGRLPTSALSWLVFVCLSVLTRAYTAARLRLVVMTVRSGDTMLAFDQWNCLVCIPIV